MGKACRKHRRWRQTARPWLSDNPIIYALGRWKPRRSVFVCDCCGYATTAALQPRGYHFNLRRAAPEVRHG